GVWGARMPPVEPPGGGGVGRGRGRPDAKTPRPAGVMVNRLWQRHFGRGIVPTPNDFGRQGQPPSHPELLDWLASRFVESGWSVKAMHRLIVLSSAYRMRSDDDEQKRLKDADNALLWRFNRPPLHAD